MATIPTTSGNVIISKPSAPTTNIFDSLMTIHSQSTAYAIGDDQVLTGGVKKIYQIRQLGGRNKTMSLTAGSKNLRKVASDAFLKIGGKSALFYVDSHLFYGYKTIKPGGQQTINHIRQLR